MDIKKNYLRSQLNYFQFENDELLINIKNDIKNKLSYLCKEDSNTILFSKNKCNSIVESFPLTNDLLLLLKDVNKLIGTQFNGLIVNYYKDGTEYSNANSNSNSYKSSINKIAILFHGSQRKLRVRDKVNKNIVIDIPLKSGNIIYMYNNFNDELIYEIPIDKHIENEMYSFTFIQYP